MLGYAGLFVLVGCTEQNQSPLPTHQQENVEHVNFEDVVYVTVDINPSVAITVDKDNKVLTVEALNEDGEVLLANITFDSPVLEEVVQILIDEAIALGFIDVDSEETIVQIDTVAEGKELQEQVRDRVKERVKEALENRAIHHRVKEKVYGQDWVKEAKDLGLLPGHYRLIQHAMLVVPELTLEDARDMSIKELMALIHEHQHEKKISPTFMEDLMEAKRRIHEEYLPQIKELQKALREAIKNGEDTEALEQELQALLKQVEAEIQEVIEDFEAKSDLIREKLKMRYEERLHHHINKFREHLQKHGKKHEHFQKGRRWRIMPPVEEKTKRHS